MKSVLCYGHYNHQNIGDELFKVAFKKLLPHYNFTFTDHLTVDLLKDKDALFFGGGSILNQSISGFNICDFQCIDIPIFYVGVGFETEIHQDHFYFLNKAKIIASRSKDSIRDNSIRKLFNIINIPDLVWLTKNQNSNYASDKKNYSYKDSVLILPNVSVLPDHSSPSWVTSAWENYKNQFAQFLDYLIDGGYKPVFYPMCQNRKDHDSFVSYQIVSMMKNRDEHCINTENIDVDDSDILWYINKFNYVITQRFHGIVLSEMVNTPVLSIYHHDKLKVENALPYYEISKHRLIESFFKLKKLNISVDYSAFDQVKQKIINILED